jgi:phage shock protein C
MTKLYRSQRDKKIFGLCGGLAEVFNVDPTILRLIVAIGVVFSGGTVLLLYVVASLVIPKEPSPMTAPMQPGFTSNSWNPSVAQTAPQAPPTASTSAAQQASTNIDDMMKDIEKKAMQKEIEELKARLAKLEKGDE